jgi:hypothetical protein
VEGCRMELVERKMKEMEVNACHNGKMPKME